MVKQFRDLQKDVHKRIREETINSMIAHVKISNPKLWGMDKGAVDFCKKVVYITLYKHCYNIGYNNLYGQISKKGNGKRNGWFSGADKTLRQNVKVVRKCLRVWGKKQIKLRGKGIWDKYSKKAGLRKQVRNSQLLMDSSDLKLAKEGKVDPKQDEWWSGKLGKEELDIWRWLILVVSLMLCGDLIHQRPTMETFLEY